MNDVIDPNVKMNETADRERLKSYHVILDQAARAIRNVFWAARHGVNFDRRMTIRVGLLLTLTLFLQASVAVSLIMASKLISGEAVTIWKFSFEATDRQTAVLMAFGTILAIMLVVAVTNFATSVFLRRLGRSIHTDALKTVIDKLDRQSQFDGFELAKINRILFQASLHLGIATEMIFRMIQPLLIVCSATVALIALDPWLLPIIALLAVPILPVYLREARRLVQLSEQFFGQSSKNLGRIVSKYVAKTRAQNVVPLSHEKSAILSDGNVSAYFNDYDAFVLSNERMSFISNIYRPFIFCAVLFYIVSRSYGPSGLENGISILPILFGIFYLLNGVLGFVSFGTNIMRFLPQVRLMRSVLDEGSQTDRARADAEGPQSIGKARKASRTGKSKHVTYLLCVTPILDRSSVAKLQSALAADPLEGIPAGQEIAFVSSQFSGRDLLAKLTLTAGQSEKWPEVEMLLRRFKLDGMLAKFPQRENSVLTDRIWNSLDARERSLFRCLPLLWTGNGQTRIIEYDVLSQLGEDVRRYLLRKFRVAPLFLHYGETSVPKSIASRGVILELDGGYEVLNLDEFYDRADALKQQSAAGESVATGTELLV